MKKKENKSHTSQHESSTSKTPYDNLIDSLRNAYNKVPGIDFHSEKEDHQDSWLTQLATH